MNYPTLKDGTRDWCKTCRNNEETDCCAFVDCCVYKKVNGDYDRNLPPTHYRDEKETNADRIRSYTDEELAEWILSVQQDLVSYYACEKHVPELPVERHTWLDWLKQEVSE